MEDVHAIYSRRGQNHPLVSKLLGRRSTAAGEVGIESEITSEN
jgi:LysR family transcriptional activator of nhaA